MIAFGALGSRRIYQLLSGHKRPCSYHCFRRHHDNQYIDAKETAVLLNCKVSSLYRLKGITQVRREDRANGRLTFRYYHRGDVQKLAEWRSGDAFAREHRANKARAGHTPRSKRSQAEKVVPAFEKRKAADGRRYLVAPVAFDVPAPYDWRENL